MTTSTAASLSDFARHVATASALHLQPSTLSSSSGWRLEDGAIRHHTGRFFSIRAMTYTTPGGVRREQPITHQPEIGTLGFVIHEGPDGVSVLANAKVEPGNVGVCQFAPTCQATLSNLERVHGGSAQPYYGPFAAPAPHAVVSDTLQSEQGTRFFRKLNRNVVVRVPDDVRTDLPVHPTHVWTSMESFLALLGRDFAVNTDARSVLVTSCWSTLVGRTPFAHRRHGVPDWLHASYHEVPDPASEVDGARERLADARRAAEPSAVLGPLDALRDWRLSDEGVLATGAAAFDVRFHAVRVRGREVPEWDQPFMQSRGRGEVVLCCAPVDGVHRFLFRLSDDPALPAGVELTPGVCREPGAASHDRPADETVLLDAVDRHGVVLTENLQSEEGGRFFRDVNRYRIVRLSAPPEPLSDRCLWLSLNAVEQLARSPQMLTNEARSAVSLLLTHL